MRFILVDRILRVEKGKEGLFLKNVSQSEDYFADHFPESPVMPGALILEGFEQASQLLIGFSREFVSYPNLDQVIKATFRHFVIPGDQLEISVSVLRQDGERIWVKGKAQSRERLVAEATLVFLLVDGKSGEKAAEHCRRLERTYRLLSSEPVEREWERLSQTQRRDLPG